jgi:thiamine monophosphate kinase
MGAKSIAAMAIVMIPYGLDAHVSETLYQMLAGACYVFNLYGVSLIGGHTCEGDEMALGFSVHGVLENGDALPKGGMKPGEVLVLTKVNLLWNFYIFLSNWWKCSHKIFHILFKKTFFPLGNFDIN